MKYVKGIFAFLGSVDPHYYYYYRMPHYKRRP